MKLTRKQWILILIGVLIIVLLWWLTKIRGSGAGATSDNQEDGSEGNAALPGPVENNRILNSAESEGVFSTFTRTKDVFI